MSSLVLPRELYTISVGYYSKSKECLNFVNDLPEPSYNLHSKIMGLELTIERFYQTYTLR